MASTHTCTHHACLLRVACFAALNLAPGCIGLVAPDCRSWGVPARGTTFRNWVNPMGVGHQFVADGNRMASRTLACIYLYVNWAHACIHDAT